MTFIDFVRISRANWWRLVAFALAGAALAYAYTGTLRVVFQADSSGYVVVGTSGQQTTGDALAGNSVANTKAEAFLTLVDKRAVAARAIQIMGTGATDSPEAIAGRVSAWLAPNSNILSVSAIGPTSESATALADATVQAMSEAANLLELGKDLTGLPTLPLNDTAGTDPKALVRIVRIDSALPGAQIGPNVRKYVLAGTAAGLVLGYALVLLRRLLDTKVRTVKDVEELARSTVLGIVPVTPELRADIGRGRVDNLGIAAEAFRQMRTNLRFVNVDNPPRSIVVTSANPGEGKSTVCATLARVLGEAGQPTILIDADLRRPMLASIFDTSGRVGLSQVLSGQVSVQEALQRTDQANVQFIAAGRTPPNPSELLGSQRMRALIEELSADHLVLLDAPPLLPVTDAGLLTAMSDGAVLVLAVGRTHKEQARLCAKVLNQVGGRLLGTVLNLAPRKGLGSVVYGYGYGHGAYQTEYYTAGAQAGSRLRAVGSHLPGRRSATERAAAEVDA